MLAPWVAGSSVVAVATVGAGLAGSEVGTLTLPPIRLGEVDCSVASGLMAARELVA